MACYITIYDLSNQDPETGRPIGISLPIPFEGQREAQEYLDNHPELWNGSPLFSYGASHPPTAEWITKFNCLCKKLNINMEVTPCQTQ